MGRLGGDSPGPFEVETRYAGTALHGKVDHRFLREDYLRVKHDKLFSKWKILIGPEDWRGHANRGEGAQKYRLHNLPGNYFGPGVYELGLTKQPPTTLHRAGGQEVRKTNRKVEKHAVVVVYLGQTDNIRQMLQTYGQTGSHLEGHRSVPGEEFAELNRQTGSGQAFDLPAAQLTTLIEPRQIPATVQHGLRLFTEVFSRGYSIAFRWAKTDTKQMAERVESELLHVFNYSWNSSLNGARRPGDILAKLELLQVETQRGHKICVGKAFGGHGWHHWEQHVGRKVGIAVAAQKPQNHFEVVRAKLESKLPNRAPHNWNHNPGDQKPGGGISTNPSATICGVMLADGTECKCPPVNGRKRCSVHKGLRVTVLNQGGGKRASKASNPLHGHAAHSPATTASVTTIKTQAMGGKRVEVNVSQTCGAFIESDQHHCCTRAPAGPGRRRCELHKGMRVTVTQKRVDVRKVNQSSERATIATRTIFTEASLVDSEFYRHRNGQD